MKKNNIVDTVLYFQENPEITLTCPVCDTKTKKIVDKSFCEDNEVKLVQGKCVKCGNDFVNRFDYETCQELTKKKKNTVVELLKELNGMGLEVSLQCKKVKGVK